MKTAVNICWFRRDLRLHDQAALYQALTSGLPVVPVFIFDRNILDQLEDRSDRRVQFIHAALEQMQSTLLKCGSTMEIFHGTPGEAFGTLLEKYNIGKVFTNRDYEPYALERDQAIATLLQQQGIDLVTCKDQVIFEPAEVLKDDGKPYTVFTPYSRKWKSLLREEQLQSFQTENYFNHFHRQAVRPIPGLEALGFSVTPKDFPSPEPDESVIRHYRENRDFPAISGTTKMSVHLRFGTISIRALAVKASRLSETYLNELIWRDFYQMILWHFPQVGRGAAFKPAYDRIEWRHEQGEFEKWCQGKTGYPIVDAGMRELNATGFMHNRVRMIVASFLCKHLLLDWRLGEAYFASKLLDFDLTSNNGGWQWAAGSGCDAAPYFRIFNPYLQTKKFDPDLAYIRKWVPELDSFSYPKPIVEHEVARKRCLEVYAKALKNT
ncbi:MAG: deoxyribodipyrimidine photo-lyase [Chitinophagaceae bacterium]|nr:deoxyribodipyrimidine photo-lyase [Chitinophagaceae bacterium]